MPRIAIIDNAIDRDVYRPVGHWSRWLRGGLGRLRRPQRPPPVPGRRIQPYHPDGVRGLHPGAAALGRSRGRALVREALCRGLSILGSCYGHQLLAVALGGPRAMSGDAGSPRSAGFPSTSWRTILCSGRPGRPMRSPIISTRSSTRTALLTVLAATPVCPIQAFRFGANARLGRPAPSRDRSGGRAGAPRSRARTGLAGGRDRKALRSEPRTTGSSGRSSRRSSA